MAQIIQTNEFESKVEKKQGIVIVDFCTTWCGPCKMLSLVFTDVSNEFQGKVDFYKVDI